MDAYVIRNRADNVTAAAASSSSRDSERDAKLCAVECDQDAAYYIAHPVRGRTVPNDNSICYPDDFEQLMLDKGVPRSRWLNTEQRNAVLIALAGHSMCILGPAGVGKSVVVNCIVTSFTEHGKAANKSVCVCAPTGVAAYNIGGATLHSAFGLNTNGSYDASVQRSQLNVTMPQMVIIDEISMVTPGDFVRIHCALKKALGERWRNASPQHSIYAPFCDAQMILTGDFHQLSPVDKNEIDNSQRHASAAAVAGSNAARTAAVNAAGTDRYISDVLYNKPRFVFETLLWREAMRCAVRLHRIIRQSDDAYRNFLMGYRHGRVSPTDLHWIERNCLIDKPRDHVTTLYPRVSQAEERNKECLALLAQPNHEYTMMTRHALNYDVSRYDAKVHAKQAHVTLAVGAEVTLTRNIDTARGYTNGARGRVVAFVQIDALTTYAKKDGTRALIQTQTLPASSRTFAGTTQLSPDCEIRTLSNNVFTTEFTDASHTHASLAFTRNSETLWQHNPLVGASGSFNALCALLPVVRFYHDEPADVPDDECSRAYVIAPAVWAISQYEESSLRVVTNHVQIPLRLAWAMSIHASQGMTLPEVDVDLRLSFAAGQSYVAISRCVDIRKLRIIAKPRDANAAGDAYEPVQWFTGTSEVSDTRERVERFETALFGNAARYYNMSPSHRKKT